MWPITLEDRLGSYHYVKGRGTHAPKIASVVVQTSTNSPVPLLVPPSSESPVFPESPPNLPLPPPHPELASSSAPPLLIPFSP
ncbi:unnamed protein product [Leuciscus chuanchicus]